MLSFNSRPHTEVDYLFSYWSLGLRSFNSRPHTEVDRATVIFSSYSARLSTHDLTRRSTPDITRWNIMDVFQLTTSHGGRLIRLCSSSIRLAFQLTTSHGGRPSYWHIKYSDKAFQLTTSHGGRHFSRQRTEHRLVLSTHDLTRRSTRILKKPMCSKFFQLTTSHGGRLP